jgi:hypothetical protein
VPDPYAVLADPTTVAIRVTGRDLRGPFRRPSPLPPGLFAVVGTDGRGGLVLPGREPPGRGTVRIFRDGPFELGFTIEDLPDEDGGRVAVRGELELMVPRRGAECFARTLLREARRVTTLDVLRRIDPALREAVAGLVAEGATLTGRAGRVSPAVSREIRRELAPALFRDGLELVGVPRLTALAAAPPPLPRPSPALERYPEPLVRVMTPAQVERAAAREADRDSTRECDLRASVVSGRSAMFFDLSRLTTNAPAAVLRAEWDDRTGAPFAGFRCNGFRSCSRAPGVWLLGHRDGVFVVGARDGQLRAALSVGPDRFDPASRTGFNSAVLRGRRVHALHSTYGMLAWPVGGGEAAEVPGAPRGRGLRLLADGRLLFAAGRRPTILDPDRGRPLRFAPAGASLVALDRDGETLYGGDAAGAVLAWSREEPGRPPLVLHRGGPVSGVARCEVEGRPGLAVASRDGLIVLDLDERRPPLLLGGRPGPLRFVAARGPWVVSSRHADATLWRTDRPGRPVDLLRGFADVDGRPHGVKALALHPGEGAT